MPIGRQNCAAERGDVARPLEQGVVARSHDREHVVAGDRRDRKPPRPRLRATSAVASASPAGLAAPMFVTIRAPLATHGRARPAYGPAAMDRNRPTDLAAFPSARAQSCVPPDIRTRDIECRRVRKFYRGLDAIPQYPAPEPMRTVFIRSLPSQRHHSENDGGDRHQHRGAPAAPGRSRRNRRGQLGKFGDRRRRRFFMRSTEDRDGTCPAARVGDAPGNPYALLTAMLRTCRLRRPQGDAAKQLLHLDAPSQHVSSPRKRTPVAWRDTRPAGSVIDNFLSVSP